MQKLEATILDMLEQSSRNIKTTPLNLGGVGGAGGGLGVPPGGFIGRLPQWAVAYDTLEAATLDTLPSGVTGASGWSLVDNLNHIRYRLNVLESGGSICVIDDDTVTSYPDTTHLHFSGAGVVINDLGGGHIQAVITATGSGGGGGLDETTANGLYLRLDTANNPLTGILQVIPDTDAENGIYVETQGDAVVLDLEQYASDSAVTSDFIFGYQEADALDVSSIFLDGVRWTNGAGNFTGNWIHFEQDNVAKFDVDETGDAYTRGQLLITDAPSNSLHYVRRDAAWVAIIPFHEFTWFYGTDLDTENGTATGQFITNSNTDSLVTEMALSVTSAGGIQIEQYGNLLYSGDMVLVQQHSDSRYWSRYQVNGSVINDVAWHRIPLQHVLSSDLGTPARDEDAHVTFEFLAPVIGSGGGGGGGIEEAPIDGEMYVRQNADWTVASGITFGANYRFIDQSGGTSDTYGVLAGSVNGSNTVYTVSKASYVSGSLEVYLNGQLQTQGSAEDWVETSPAAGTFTFATAPLTGDLITVSYMKSNAATGNADTLDGLDSTAFALSSVLADYITGLQMVWVSATALTVKVGSAYIPSVGYIVNASSDIAKSSLSLSNSTWYHVYLYLNSGTPDVEIVTTAPVVYHGVARQKTSDNSRRYVGSIRTDASGNIQNFQHQISAGLIYYRNKQDSSPFRVLTNGQATTETSVDCSAVVPVSGRITKMKVSNTDTTRWVDLGNSEDSVTLGGGNALVIIDSSAKALFDFPLDSSQALTYMLNAANTGGGAYIDIYGYFFER